MKAVKRFMSWKWFCIFSYVLTIEGFRLKLKGKVSCVKSRLWYMVVRSGWENTWTELNMMRRKCGMSSRKERQVQSWEMLGVEAGVMQVASDWQVIWCWELLEMRVVQLKQFIVFKCIHQLLPPDSNVWSYINVRGKVMQLCYSFDV